MGIVICQGEYNHNFEIPGLGLEKSETENQSSKLCGVYRCLSYPSIVVLSCCILWSIRSDFQVAYCFLIYDLLIVWSYRSHRKSDYSDEQLWPKKRKTSSLCLDKDHLSAFTMTRVSRRSIISCNLTSKVTLAAIHQTY